MLTHLCERRRRRRTRLRCSPFCLSLTKEPRLRVFGRRAAWNLHGESPRDGSLSTRVYQDVYHDPPKFPSSLPRPVPPSSLSRPAPPSFCRRRWLPGHNSLPRTPGSLRLYGDPATSECEASNVGRVPTETSVWDWLVDDETVTRVLYVDRRTRDSTRDTSGIVGRSRHLLLVPEGAVSGPPC